MRDGTQTVILRAGITPRIIANNTPILSAIIDTQGWEWCKAILVTGTLADADATFTVLIEESTSDTMVGATAVPDSVLVSQTEGVAPELAASFVNTSDNNIRKIEILPTLRYLRLTLIPANNTGNAFVAMAWHLGSPEDDLVVQLAA